MNPMWWVFFLAGLAFLCGWVILITLRVQGKTTTLTDISPALEAGNYLARMYIGSWIVVFAATVLLLLMATL
jgi:hypothetical protein